MLINMRNAMMAGKRLPYDAEVEYLESTGTQYIDTGIVIASNVRVVAKLMIKSQSMGGSDSLFLGGRDVDNVGQGFTMQMTATETRTDFFGSRVVIGPSIFDEVLELDKNGNQCTVNGTTVTQPSASATGKSHILLSGFNVNNNVKPNRPYNIRAIRWFSIKMYVSGTLVRELALVRKDGVGEMYDRVTSTFMERNGTFVIGPDK